ncbi:hypothetical protein DPMN_028647 [Dreissena polymorpha]|uniref:Uncharacterized protein n=1 Tax=Dreissena polymorpha TaxID=45954 RepID=A0A9D4REJ6_DREPO|nr:hypothetical protein DPMN_028647 [Dreissena polymorpha]
MCYVAEEFANNKNWLEKCNGYRKEHILLIGKFLLAVPKSCTVPRQLPSNSAAGIVISNVDTFEFKRIHAGKNRYYVVTIN